MGMYDQIRIHSKWLDIPENSFMRECYLGKDEFFSGFQTKDIDTALYDFEINKKGQLYQISSLQWNDNIEGFLGRGALERKDVNIFRKDFNGSLTAYCSLWGSGKEGTGSWPSPIYSDLGDCEITFDMLDGKVHRVRSFILKEPKLKTKAEKDEYDRKQKEKQNKQQEKDKQKLTKSPIEWEG